MNSLLQGSLVCVWAIQAPLILAHYADGQTALMLAGCVKMLLAGKLVELAADR